MKKSFVDWLPVKQKIQDQNNIRDVFFREGEVWWCSIGLNIGFEQDGKSSDYRRPVLILKKFNQYAFISLPLTTKEKSGQYYKECFIVNDAMFRMVVVSQIRFTDSKRLLDKVGVLTSDSFSEIKKAVRDLF